jgi:hypothetical protein
VEREDEGYNPANEKPCLVIFDEHPAYISCHDVDEYKHDPA